jgi:hypothetical protein
MAEQSSTVAAFRAVIMLVCLIMIPVAAFCGSSFPAVLKAIESGRCPTLADFRGPSGPPPAQSSEAPRYIAPAAAAPQPGDPKLAGFSGRPGGLETIQQGESAAPGVIHANFLAPVGSTRPTERQDLSTSFPQSKDTSPSHGLTPVSRDGRLTPPEQLPTTDRNGDPASQVGTSSNTSANNQLMVVVKRLQELGATYFVLELCGDQKDSFRFFCKMSIGGNPQVTKPFWSFDRDPLKAMMRVLKQVEESQIGGG